MAEENKVDMSTVGGDGSREAGTGIGLATSDGMQANEAGFLDAAAAQLDALAGNPEEEPRRKRKQPEVIEDVELEEQDEPEDFEEEDEQDEAPEEIDREEGAVGEELEEEPDKVSIRLNGKKATLDQVLDSVGAVVVVNGEEIDVSGTELIKGYQRGKDYSDKTTEMKKERDEMMPYNQMVAFAKQDPQFLEHVQNYFQNGPYPELTANPDLKTPDSDLAKMMDQNDSAYDPSRAQNIVQMRSEWMAKNADRQQVNQRAQQDYMQRQQAWASDQVAQAQNVINQIGMDQGVEYKEGETEYGVKSQQVLDFLKSSGYNEQEISGQVQISASDARAAITAYKASEYDRMMKESDAPRVTLGKKRKKIAPPRSQRSGIGGTQKTSGRRQQRDSFRKASKEQTTESWISAIDKRLNR
jgi:hypothetical protein